MMDRWSRIAVAWTLPILAAIAASGETACARAVDELKRAAKPLALTPVRPERFTLRNGVTVYFLRNERLPLVTVRAVFRAGSIWEPSEKAGVAELTGKMLRRGGAGALDADATDEALDFLASEISSVIGTEQGSVTLSCLTENLDPSLTVFADMLRRPAFDAGKLEVQKNILREEIRRENDNPIQVALQEYAVLLWGEGHPRARRPTESTVDALSREDVVAFHEHCVRPSNLTLGVAGDTTREAIQKKLEKAFGDWKSESVEFPPAPAPPPWVPRVAFAAKPVSQSTVLLGHLGPREDDPHRAAGQVMMDILAAGGFTSYVVDRVRNDEGLAYAAGGILAFGKLDPGAFVLYAISKSESTCRATDLLLEQIDRIRTTPVTEDELIRARDGIVNSRAFDFDSAEEIVRDFMDLAYFGLPENHSETVLASIGRVTSVDVQAAAKALLDPTRLSMLAVGDSSKLDCTWNRYADRYGVPLTRISLEARP